MVVILNQLSFEKLQNQGDNIYYLTALWGKDLWRHLGAVKQSNNSGQKDQPEMVPQFLE